MLSAVFMEGPRDARQCATFALTVSRVSRYWHVTAMQTPFLWSGIPILLWYTGTGYEQFLQIFLHRSKSHPLDITLTVYSHDDPNSPLNRMRAHRAAYNTCEV